MDFAVFVVLLAMTIHHFKWQCIPYPPQLRCLPPGGFPNYFGMQRFGTGMRHEMFVGYVLDFCQSMGSKAGHEVVREGRSRSDEDKSL